MAIARTIFERNIKDANITDRGREWKGKVSQYARSAPGEAAVDGSSGSPSQPPCFNNNSWASSSSLPEFSLETIPSTSSLSSEEAECIICMSVEDRVHLGECQHMDTCHACLRHWVANQIKEKQRPACATCRTVLKYKTVLHVLGNDSQTRDLFQRQLSEADLSAARSAAPFIWCPFCVRALPTGGHPTVICTECERNLCVVHEREALPRKLTISSKRNSIYLQGNSEMCCMEGKMQKERATEMLISQITRKCPGCEVPTEKNGGCQHMTCTQCKCEWFWCCRRLYRHEAQAREHYRYC